MIKNDKGIALILVISVLAVMVSLFVTFMIASRLQTAKAFRFRSAMKANNIVDAGIEHAKAMLRQDKMYNGYDHYGETWHLAFVGSDIDNDGDGSEDSRWMSLVNASGDVYGRYAVLVIDEASKVNINSAGYYNENLLTPIEGWSTFEVSLKMLFDLLSLPSPLQMTSDLLAYRYGGNQPGDADPSIDDNANNIFLSHDGIDNDADGERDELNEGLNEPAEFNIFHPYGDDEPFLSPDEIKNIDTIKPSFNELEKYITTFSNDKNWSSDGKMRLDLNQSSGTEILQFLQDLTISNAEQLTANILDYRDANLIQSSIVTSNGPFYGIEGIRINELMIRPVYTFQATDHTNLTGPGGNWNLDSGYFSNSIPEIAGVGGIWWFENIPPGTYYLKMYANASGQTIGDVKVGVTTHVSMLHGETFVRPVYVLSDGRLKITIYNGEVDQPGFTTIFTKFELSQQPDAEYIELVNITDQDIDLSSWYLEGLRTNDLIGVIPEATVIPSFDYLVLAIDKDDLQMDELSSNDISFNKVWTDTSVDQSKVVQLQFSHTVSRTDDVLNDYPSSYLPDNPIVLKLKDANGNVIDQAKFFESDAITYRASEKDDPANNVWVDDSHIPAQWFPSDGIPGFERQGTPTLENNNINIIGHTIGGSQTDVKIKNGPFASVGGVGFVPTGLAWVRIGDDYIRMIADYFCISRVRLEAEGNAVSGAEGGWQEVSRSAPNTNRYVSSSVDDIGEWLFDRDDRIENGIYYLDIHGEFREAIAISYQLEDGSWTDFSPPLLPGDNDMVRFGLIEIGTKTAISSPNRELRIRVKNMSDMETAAFDAIVLSPANTVLGKININTASELVLQTLPGVTSTIANNIFTSSEKPFGHHDGIGDVMAIGILGPTGEARRTLFKKISNLISVKSDVFSIYVTAETLQNGKVLSQKKVRAVVER